MEAGQRRGKGAGLGSADGSSKGFDETLMEHWRPLTTRVA